MGSAVKIKTGQLALERHREDAQIETGHNTGCSPSVKTSVTHWINLPKESSNPGLGFQIQRLAGQRVKWISIKRVSGVQSKGLVVIAWESLTRKSIVEGSSRRNLTKNYQKQYRKQKEREPCIIAAISVGNCGSLGISTNTPMQPLKKERNRSYVLIFLPTWT